jgi:endonuclease YncB( thermonuclease family)
MFGWRRRSKGFEWREYVRTTVLVRRADRQRKIDDVRVAALNKVKDTADRGLAAGRAGVETLAQTTSQIVKAAIGVLWTVRASGAGTWRATRAAASHVVARLPAVPRPALSLPAPRKVARPADDASRPNAQDIRPDVGFRWPVSPKMIGGGTLALAVIYVIGPMLNSESALTPAKFVPADATQRDSPRASVIETGAIEKDSTIISGRATAIRGDMLRINDRLIQLAGIETPQRAQRCQTKSGKNWNCGASARQELGKLVRRKPVVCTPYGDAASGAALATCTVGDIDLAAELVRKGQVFATAGFFVSYGAIEADARAAGLGIWQGASKRPQEWRVDTWEEAKRTTPDGCPIKGRASGKVYVMPWTSGYDSRRMRTVRGDRWFCSEEEAQAAGFKPAQRS